ncbi:hypothetical protein [Clostridium manihotivorum]|uniref:Uncharacterized protein n=1 Tax=Clostridium manihotivorum TaxID=2320868 RepID=A0A410DSW5_9CLOT|nr:hypothetical protein [Clostridium manihotivorum]QAA32145.1 hypothetical protein C1I91_11045 [Clostridium manihotivorum]
MNFYKALKAHVIICVVAYLSYAITCRFADKKISMLNIALIFIMYLLSGSFMDSKGAVLDNLKSVAIIFGIGTVIWIISVAAIGFGSISSNSNWIIYGVYTAYFLPLINIFNIKSPFVYFIAALLPTLLMWLGIELKGVISGKDKAKQS